MTIEEWRDIAGYEGIYQVSSYGNVRSLDRVVQTKIGPQKWRGKLLRHRISNCGYVRYSLRKNGETTDKLAHHLVLENFVGPRPKGMEGCHNDGNKLNNNLTNLRWDTSTANNYDLVKHGTHYWASKTHCNHGHNLFPENLTRVGIRNGARQCLSCNRARAHIQRHPNLKPQMQEISDSYYKKILEEIGA